MAEPLSDEELQRLEQLAASRGAVRSFDVLPLVAEVRRLRTRLADAEGEGCTLHVHAKHGKEAEELRKGIERIYSTRLKTAQAIAESAPGTEVVPAAALHALLDRVDARDSLAHLRANEELRDARAANKRGLRSQQKAIELLLEALVDGLDSGRCSTKAVRRVLMALGCKAKELPQDIPPAGGKRGRRG